MGLAPKIVDEIFAALRQLASTGVSLLIVEQYINRALEMADQVVLLDRGQIAYNGSPGDLDQATVMRRYLGIDASAS
jgi:branched-chain amino acid transport system ATP-binding protein